MLNIIEKARAWKDVVKTYFETVFKAEKDAIAASQQHICLCRNEDIMLPEAEIIQASEDDFGKLPGFELRFGESKNSFLVGYNRFEENKPMYGWLEYNGQKLL